MAGLPFQRPQYVPVSEDSTLRTLLGNAVDYAGLFPPAALSLADAAGQYASYRSDKDAWMLGRFICPVPKLRALSGWGDSRGVPGTWPISVLLTGGATDDAFLATLEGDVRTIQAEQDRRLAFMAVETAEVRWPGGVSDEEAPRVDGFLQRASAIISAELPSLGEMYFELPLGLAPEALRAVLAGMRRHNEEARDENGPIFGAKARCGGTEAAAFPSAEQLAGFLGIAGRSGVRYKATAGLHHPIYQYRPEYGAYMHGFLNVFFAATLSVRHSLDEREIVRILTDTEAVHFRIDETGIGYGQWTADPETLYRFRSDGLVSFGSCSFDEPREDLRALGFMH